MKYERFEELPVWRASIELVDRIYTLTKHAAFREPGDLCDQLRRAALSISNNIAEGFERGTTQELVYFLYIGRGSAGEVRSMLRFCERREEMADLRFEISNLISLAESCSRQIRGWADSLQNTDIQGQKHLTERSRAEYESKRRADVFLRQIDEVVRRRVEETMGPKAARKSDDAI